jgi:iron complex transport system substrate-binding protein
MEKNIALAIILLIINGCYNPKTSHDSTTDIFPKLNHVKIEYAKKFSIEKSSPLFTKIIINSNTSKFKFKDSIYLVHSKKFNPKNIKKIKKSYKNIALQSSTYIPYLQLIKKDTLIKGLSGVSYVQNNEIKKLLEQNNVKELSINGKINMESLLSIQPDLFLIYPYELESVDKYNEKGIQTLLIAEYLEETPLARLEWLKFFGLVFNNYNCSDSIFQLRAKTYNNLIQPLDTSKTFFFNLPYNDVWDMPSNHSITANLVKDAGLKYIYNTNTNTVSDNITFSKEEVWQDAVSANYWIIIAARKSDYSLTDLLNEEEIYKDFKAVKNGNVIFCNTTTTNYFTKGVVEPHIMLKDIISCVNKDLNSTTYFKLLK